MKRFLLTIGLFLLFFALVYPFILYFGVELFSSDEVRGYANISYRPASYGHLQTRLAEVEDFGEVDLLFMGSSQVYRGFDTRIFRENGYNAFNLGSSSQTPRQSLYFLQRYVDDLKPKKVIVETFPGMLVSDGIESTTDIISNSTPDFKLLLLVLQQKHIRTFNTLIYKCIDRYVFRKRYKEPKTKKRNNDTYISGGYVASDLQYFENNMEIEPRDVLPSKYQLDALYEIKKLLDKRNISLILVQAPLPEARINSYIHLEEFDMEMEKISEYHNFNTFMHLPDSAFIDANHLNQNGVDIFNNYLIKEILN